MLEEGSLQAALEEIVPQAFQATLFRCVSLRALLGLVKDPTGKLLITRPNPDFLYAGGPVIGGGRFTPKGGARSLYMGETAHTAKLEKRQGVLGTEVVRSKRFSSIRYPSTAYPRGKCIVVFPDRMHTGESVAVLDEDSIINQIISRF